MAIKRTKHPGVHQPPSHRTVSKSDQKAHVKPTPKPAKTTALDTFLNAAKETAAKLIRPTITRITTGAILAYTAGQHISRQIGQITQPVSEAFQRAQRETQFEKLQNKFLELQRVAKGMPEIYQLELATLAPEFETYDDSINVERLRMDLERIAFFISQHKAMGIMPEIPGLSKVAPERYQAAWTTALENGDKQAQAIIFENFQLITQRAQLDEMPDMPQDDIHRIDNSLGNLSNPLVRQENHDTSARELTNLVLASTTRAAKRDARKIILSSDLPSATKNVLLGAIEQIGSKNPVESQRASIAMNYVDNVLSPLQEIHTKWRSLVPWAGGQITRRLEYTDTNNNINPITIEFQKLSDYDANQVSAAYKKFINRFDNIHLERTDIPLVTDQDWLALQKLEAHESAQLKPLQILISRAEKTIEKQHKPNAAERHVQFLAMANRIFGADGRSPGHTSDAQVLRKLYDISDEDLMRLRKKWPDGIPHNVARQRLLMVTADDEDLDKRRIAAVEYEYYLLQQQNRERRADWVVLLDSKDLHVRAAADTGFSTTPRTLSYTTSERQTIYENLKREEDHKNQYRPIAALSQLRNYEDQIRASREIIQEYTLTGKSKTAEEKLIYQLSAGLAVRIGKFLHNFDPMDLDKTLEAIGRARREISRGKYEEFTVVAHRIESSNTLHKIESITNEAARVNVARDLVREGIAFGAATIATAGIGAVLELGTAARAASIAHSAGKTVRAASRIGKAAKWAAPIVRKVGEAIVKQSTFLHTKAAADLALSGHQTLYDAAKSPSENLFHLAVSIAEFELMGGVHKAFKEVWTVAPVAQRAKVLTQLVSGTRAKTHELIRDVAFFHLWSPVAGGIQSIANRDIEYLKGSIDSFFTEEGLQHTGMMTIAMGAGLGTPISQRLSRRVSRTKVSEIREVEHNQQRILDLDRKIANISGKNDLETINKIAELRLQQRLIAEDSARLLDEAAERHPHSESLREQAKQQHLLASQHYFAHRHAERIWSLAQIDSHETHLQHEYATTKGLHERKEIVADMHDASQRRIQLIREMFAEGAVDAKTLQHAESQELRLDFEERLLTNTEALQNAQIVMEALSPSSSITTIANHAVNLLIHYSLQRSLILEARIFSPKRFAPEALRKVDAAITTLSRILGNGNAAAATNHYQKTLSDIQENRIRAQSIGHHLAQEQTALHKARNANRAARSLATAHQAMHQRHRHTLSYITQFGANRQLLATIKEHQALEVRLLRAAKKDRTLIEPTQLLLHLAEARFHLMRLYLNTPESTMRNVLEARLNASELEMSALVERFRKEHPQLQDILPKPKTVTGGISVGGSQITRLLLSVLPFAMAGVPVGPFGKRGNNDGSRDAPISILTGLSEAQRMTLLLSVYKNSFDLQGREFDPVAAEKHAQSNPKSASDSIRAMFNNILSIAQLIEFVDAEPELRGEIEIGSHRFLELLDAVSQLPQNSPLRLSGHKQTASTVSTYLAAMEPTSTRQILEYVRDNIDASRGNFYLDLIRPTPTPQPPARDFGSVKFLTELPVAEFSSKPSLGSASKQRSKPIQEWLQQNFLPHLGEPMEVELRLFDLLDTAERQLKLLSETAKSNPQDSVSVRKWDSQKMIIGEVIVAIELLAASAEGHRRAIINEAATQARQLYGEKIEPIIRSTDKFLEELHEKSEQPPQDIEWKHDPRLSFLVGQTYGGMVTKNGKISKRAHDGVILEALSLHLESLARHGAMGSDPSFVTIGALRDALTAIEEVPGIPRPGSRQTHPPAEGVLKSYLLALVALNSKSTTAGLKVLEEALGINGKYTSQLKSIMKETRSLPHRPQKGPPARSEQPVITQPEQALAPETATRSAPHTQLTQDESIISDSMARNRSIVSGNRDANGNSILGKDAYLRSRLTGMGTSGDKILINALVNRETGAIVSIGSTPDIIKQSLGERVGQVVIHAESSGNQFHIRSVISHHSNTIEPRLIEQLQKTLNGQPVIAESLIKEAPKKPISKSANLKFIENILSKAATVGDKKLMDEAEALLTTIRAESPNLSHIQALTKLAERIKPLWIQHQVREHQLKSTQPLSIDEMNVLYGLVENGAIAAETHDRLIHYIHTIEGVSPRIRGYLKKLENLDKAHQHSALSGMLFSLSRIDTASRLLKRYPRFVKTTSISIPGYNGFAAKTDLRDIYTGDAKPLHAKGPTKVQSDIPVVDGHIWEVKSYIRPNYGTNLEDYNQALKLQRAVEIGIEAKAKGSFDSTKHARAATIEITGNVHPAFVTFMSRHTPDVELLYSLQLPDGHEIVFPLKPARPETHSLKRIHPPTALSARETSIANGIKRLIEFGELPGVFYSGVVEAKDITDSPFKSKLEACIVDGLLDPMLIKDADTLREYERIAHAKRIAILEEAASKPIRHRPIKIYMEPITDEVIAYELKKIDAFLATANIGVQKQYLINREQDPELANRVQQEFANRLRLVAAHERERIGNEPPEVQAARRKLHYRGPAHGYPLDPSHIYMDVVKAVRSQLGAEGKDPEKIKRRLLTGRLYEVHEEFPTLPDVVAAVRGGAYQDMRHTITVHYAPGVREDVSGNREYAVTGPPRLAEKIRDEVLNLNLNRLGALHSDENIPYAVQRSLAQNSKRLEAAHNNILALRADREAAIKAVPKPERRPVAEKHDEIVRQAKMDLLELYKTILGSKQFKAHTAQIIQDKTDTVTKFIYIVDANGVMRVYEESIAPGAERPTHSVLAGGRNIYAAGEFFIRGMNVISINNGSGHYRPDAAETLSYVRALIKESGFNITTGKGATRLEHIKFPHVVIDTPVSFLWEGGVFQLPILPPVQGGAGGGFGPPRLIGKEPRVLESGHFDTGISGMSALPHQSAPSGPIEASQIITKWVENQFTGKSLEHQAAIALHVAQQTNRWIETSANHVKHLLERIENGDSAAASELARLPELFSAQWHNLQSIHGKMMSVEACQFPSVRALISDMRSSLSQVVSSLIAEPEFFTEDARLNRLDIQEAQKTIVAITAPRGKHLPEGLSTPGQLYELARGTVAWLDRHAKRSGRDQDTFVWTAKTDGSLKEEHPAHGISVVSKIWPPDLQRNETLAARLDLLGWKLTSTQNGDTITVRLQVQKAPTRQTEPASEVRAPAQEGVETLFDAHIAQYKEFLERVRNVPQSDLATLKAEWSAQAPALSNLVDELHVQAQLAQVTLSVLNRELAAQTTPAKSAERDRASATFIRQRELSEKARLKYGSEVQPLEILIAETIDARLKGLPLPEPDGEIGFDHPRSVRDSKTQDYPTLELAQAGGPNLPPVQGGAGSGAESVLGGRRISVEGLSANEANQMAHAELYKFNTSGEHYSLLHLTQIQELIATGLLTEATRQELAGSVAYRLVTLGPKARDFIVKKLAITPFETARNHGDALDIWRTELHKKWGVEEEIGFNNPQHDIVTEPDPRWSGQPDEVKSKAPSGIGIVGGDAGKTPRLPGHGRPGRATTSISTTEFHDTLADNFHLTYFKDTARQRECDRIISRWKRQEIKIEKHKTKTYRRASTDADAITIAEAAFLARTEARSTAFAQLIELRIKDQLLAKFGKSARLTDMDYEAERNRVLAEILSEGLGGMPLGIAKHRISVEHTDGILVLRPESVKDYEAIERNTIGKDIFDEAISGGFFLHHSALGIPIILINPSSANRWGILRHELQHLRKSYSDAFEPGNADPRTWIQVDTRGKLDTPHVLDEARSYFFVRAKDETLAYLIQGTPPEDTINHLTEAGNLYDYVGKKRGQILAVLKHHLSETDANKLIDRMQVDHHAGLAMRIHHLYEAVESVIDHGYHPENARQLFAKRLHSVPYDNWTDAIPRIKKDILSAPVPKQDLPQPKLPTDQHAALRAIVDSEVATRPELLESHVMDYMAESARWVQLMSQKVKAGLPIEMLEEVRRKAFSWNDRPLQLLEVLHLRMQEAKSRQQVWKQQGHHDTQTLAQIDQEVRKRTDLYDSAFAAYQESGLAELRAKLDRRILIQTAHAQHLIKESAHEAIDLKPNTLPSPPVFAIDDVGAFVTRVKSHSDLAPLIQLAETRPEYREALNRLVQQTPQMFTRLTPTEIQKMSRSEVGIAAKGLLKGMQDSELIKKLTAAATYATLLQHPHYTTPVLVKELNALMDANTTSDPARLAHAYAYDAIRERMGDASFNEALRKATPKPAVVEHEIPMPDGYKKLRLISELARYQKALAGRNDASTPLLAKLDAVIRNHQPMPLVAVTFSNILVEDVSRALAAELSTEVSISYRLLDGKPGEPKPQQGTATIEVHVPLNRVVESLAQAHSSGYLLAHSRQVRVVLNGADARAELVALARQKEIGLEYSLQAEAGETHAMHAIGALTLFSAANPTPLFPVGSLGNSLGHIGELIQNNPGASVALAVGTIALGSAALLYRRLFLQKTQPPKHPNNRPRVATPTPDPIARMNAEMLEILGRVRDSEPKISDETLHDEVVKLAQTPPAERSNPKFQKQLRDTIEMARALYNRSGFITFPRKLGDAREDKAVEFYRNFESFESHLHEILEARSRPVSNTPPRAVTPPRTAPVQSLPKPMPNVSEDMKIHLKPFVDAIMAKTEEANRDTERNLDWAAQELATIEEGKSPTRSDLDRWRASTRRQRKPDTSGYGTYIDPNKSATIIIDPADANARWQHDFTEGVRKLLPKGISPEFPVSQRNDYFIPGLSGWFWGGNWARSVESHRLAPYQGRIFFGVDYGIDGTHNIPKASILYATLTKFAKDWEKQGVDVQFKIAASRRGRNDAGVLYFHAKDQKLIHEAMQKISQLKVTTDHLPLFVAPLTDLDGNIMPGIGFAQHPKSDVSFGQRRIALLRQTREILSQEAARGIVRSRAEIEGILAACLRDGGVDPSVPAFDLGGQALFSFLKQHMRFSETGEPPTQQSETDARVQILDIRAFMPTKKPTLFVEGVDIPREYKEGDSVKIGRDGSNIDISFPKDELVSRIHAKIVFQQDGEFIGHITDLASTNGTKVIRNGITITLREGEQFKLKTGDAIQVGSHRIYVGEPPPPIAIKGNTNEPGPTEVVPIRFREGGAQFRPEFQPRNRKTEHIWQVHSNDIQSSDRLMDILRNSAKGNPLQQRWPINFIMQAKPNAPEESQILVGQRFWPGQKIAEEGVKHIQIANGGYAQWAGELRAIFTEQGQLVEVQFNANSGEFGRQSLNSSQDDDIRIVRNLLAKVLHINPNKIRFVR